MGLLNRFFEVNRNLCRKVELYLPQAKVDLYRSYEEEVVHYMNSKPGQVVVDVGGGKSCSFAKRRDPALQAKIVAVDISEEEIRENRDVDEKRTADIMQGLPFGAEEVDLVVSSFVLEHLENLEAFVFNSKNNLKKGGHFIHQFPSKFAPFALINQAVPRKLSRGLVHFFVPGSKGIRGFPAFYDNCYYSAIEALLDKHGFKVTNTHLSYYQSRYFSFFFPLFVISTFYELLVYALGLKNLCAYVLVVATKE